MVVHHPPTIPTTPASDAPDRNRDAPTRRPEPAHPWNRPARVAVAALATLGCLASIVGNFVGTAINPNVGFIASTISDVAAGRHAWIQDFGLYLLAAGMVALAVALQRWRLSGWDWTLSAAALGVTGLLILAIAGYDEYGDLDVGGLVIHMELVYAMGTGFVAAPAFAAPGLGRLGDRWRNASLVIAALWALLAPTYFFTSTGWDGLYERAVMIVMLTWTTGAAWLLARAPTRST